MLRLRSYIPYMAGLRLVARRMHLTPNRFTTFPEGVTHVWSLSDAMVCDCDSNAMGGTNYIGHARHVLARSFERDWRNIAITLTQLCLRRMTELAILNRPWTSGSCG